MASLGLRAAAPLLGAVIGLGVGMTTCGRGPDDSEACPAGAAIIGLIVGVLAASAADVAILARDDSPAPSRSGSALVPSIAIAKDGLSVGVGGRF